MNDKENENQSIEICDECFTASCWHGEFMCDNARNAGTTTRTRLELINLDLESVENFNDAKLRLMGIKS